MYYVPISICIAQREIKLLLLYYYYFFIEWWTYALLILRCPLGIGGCTTSGTNPQLRHHLYSGNGWLTTNRTWLERQSSTFRTVPSSQRSLPGNHRRPRIDTGKTWKNTLSSDDKTTGIPFVGSIKNCTLNHCKAK